MPMSTTESNNKNVIESLVISAFIGAIISVISFINALVAYNNSNLKDATSVFNMSSLLSLVLTFCAYILLIVSYNNVHKHVWFIKAIIWGSLCWEIILITIYALYGFKTIIAVPIDGAIDSRFVFSGTANKFNNLLKPLTLDGWATSILGLNIAQAVIGAVRYVYNNK